MNETAITWQFDIGDFVVPASVVEELKYTSGRRPTIGRIIVRKYEQCHGGCGQIAYIVEVGGNRGTFAEASLVLCTPTLMQQLFQTKKVVDDE
jgi:hypothetical protein